MSLNTPAWLQETEAPAASSTGPVAVPPPPPPEPVAASTNNNNNTGAPSASAMTDEQITADDPDLPGVILTMRLANMGAAVFLVVVAVRRVA
jgi:hypothetical protein